MVKKGDYAFTGDQIDWIYRNVLGKSNQELTDAFNQEFGTNKTLGQLRKFKHKHHLYSGIVHIPTYVLGKPDGSIRKKDGRNWIKISLPDGSAKWIQLHRYIWERENGPIPKGFVLIFGDGNSNNCEIGNLILVSRQELITMNCLDLIKNNADLTRTGVLIADLVNKIGKRAL